MKSSHISERTLGIDASNIRLGGGITHLRELLLNFEPSESTIKKVILWGGEETLSKMPNYLWLEKISHSLLNGNLLCRTFWQLFFLHESLKKNKCNALFVPGGWFFSPIHPVITMNQNLLPFEAKEIQRLGFSMRALKFTLLKWVLLISFRKADGIIFLSEYAKKTVTLAMGFIPSNWEIIPHGSIQKYKVASPKNDLEIGLGIYEPISLLYVSNIDLYKHQSQVLEAVFRLREVGYKIEIIFIGPASSAPLELLNKKLNKFDPDRKWARYIGEVPHELMEKHYQEADIGIFASSCETFGIILLEKMAAGLPVACSSLSAMPEILKDGGLYFDPEEPDTIANAIELYIKNPKIRLAKKERALVLSEKYSWKDCSRTTFSFIEKIIIGNKQ